MTCAPESRGLGGLITYERLDNAPNRLADPVERMTNESDKQRLSSDDGSSAPPPTGADDARTLDALQAHLAAIVTSSPDAIVSFAPDDGRITSWNHAAAALFGWSEAEVLGQPGMLLVPDPSPEGDPMGIYRWVLEGRPVRDHETTRRTRAGTLIPVALTAARMDSSDGRLIGISCIFRDLRPRYAAEAALAAREARLSAMLESTTDSVFALSPEWRFTFLNRRALSHIASGHDLVGQPIWQAFPEAIGGPLWLAFTRCMEARVPTEADQFYEPLGRHFAARAFPAEDGGITVFFNDVTETQHTARALAESEVRFRSTFDQAAVGFAHVALDGSWLRVNHRLCTMLGYTEAELSQRTFQDLTYPDDLRSDLEHMRQLLAGEVATYSREKRYLRKDGSVIWTNLTVSLLRDGQGVPQHLISVVEDISARKAVEAAHRESEARLRAVLDNVPVGVLLAEAPTGRIVVGNRHVEEILRHPILSSPNVEAYREWESYHGDGRRVEGHEYPLARALAGEEAPSLTVQYRRGDNTLCWIRISGTPVRDPVSGAITGAVVAINDIDAERRASEALATSEAQLRVLTETLEERVREEVRARELAQTRLLQAEKLSALGQLAGGIAHDFNNVLQAVEGSASLIKSRATNPASVERFASIIEDAAQRGTSITRRLLAFARRGELRAEALDLPDLLDSVQEVLSRTLGAHIQIRLQCEEDVPPVLADRGQLETALINLATNARDAMPNGGMLSFHVGVETVEAPRELSAGRYVRIAVSDTGIGMDAVTLSHVMEPFFTTKPQGKGTGLGLPMVRGFTEQSGGGLAIASEVDRGTTVTLWLPAADRAAHAGPVLRERRSVAAAPGAPRILLVDDELLVRQVVAAQLTDHGYDVVQADGGATALALLSVESRIDLIISDLSMPGLDGAALIREARRLRPDLPAILLTGYAGEAADLTTGGTPEGRFGLLRKPASTAELADHVRRLLAEAGAD
ncbi:MAG TPA: PAS domain S-box protein [Rhodopila sp.]|nr:PAS domain S-box protein [Rhodopila sp.]